MPPVGSSVYVWREPETHSMKGAVQLLGDVGRCLAAKEPFAGNYFGTFNTIGIDREASLANDKMHRATFPNEKAFEKKQHAI